MWRSDIKLNNRTQQKQNYYMNCEFFATFYFYLLTR